MDSKNIRKIPRIIEINTAARMFQYIVLNNVLLLNKKLLKFKKDSTRLFSFCKLEEKETLHPFYKYIETQTHLQQLYLLWQ